MSFPRKSPSLGPLNACAVALLLAMACHPRPKQPAIECRLIAAAFHPSSSELGALDVKLRVALSATHRSVKVYPYADMAFQILPQAERSVTVLPRPQLRPAPKGGPERRALTLKKKPLAAEVEIDLSDSYLIKPNATDGKGTGVQFLVRYSFENDYSNYILVTGTL